MYGAIAAQGYPTVQTAHTVPSVCVPYNAVHGDAYRKDSKLPYTAQDGRRYDEASKVRTTDIMIEIYTTMQYSVRRRGNVSWPP